MTILLSILTMASLAGCGGKKDSAPEIIGTWKVVNVETAGVSVDFDKFAQQLGQDADSLVMEITVKEDKSFSINMMGQKKEGTWEEKSGKYTLTLDGTDQEAEIKDGKLTLIDESVGTSMTFEKK